MLSCQKTSICILDFDIDVVLGDNYFGEIKGDCFFLTLEFHLLEYNGGVV